jgi:hypothetical protein
LGYDKIASAAKWITISGRFIEFFLEHGDKWLFSKRGDQDFTSEFERKNLKDEGRR